MEEAGFGAHRPPRPWPGASSTSILGLPLTPIACASPAGTGALSGARPAQSPAPPRDQRARGATSTSSGGRRRRHHRHRAADDLLVHPPEPGRGRPRPGLLRQAPGPVRRSSGWSCMVAVALVDYQFLRDIAPAIYGAALFVLLLVLSRWAPSGGAPRPGSSWAPYQFEPSEVAKLALVIALAAFCAAHRGELDTGRLTIALGIAGMPLLLIYLQPDVGTGMVFVAILMGILLVGGRQPRQIAILTLLGITAIVMRAAARRPEGLPARPAVGLPRPQGGRAAVGLQPQPVEDRHRRRRCRREGPVPGHPDQPVLRARAAHRLHLHRRGRGAGLRGLVHPAGAVRRGDVADVAGGDDGQGPVRHARLRRACWPCSCSRSSRTWA